ncbi:alpha/beta fold hydrolase [Pseudoflavitalea sp. G-6-1-2]|uniref:alpha/beta fold hydrolase n=1 Tax=Pseudoflavitalea sp. G-6-1-2 TaxID=2728841 RepID=UPI00146C5502|nr:alpha/beta hydrolase [Pseudoflavitalea sp. G-6-1-2]NML23862.1 alpha/beta fold hydrolase [Pseudoflavitalea sp. G-6-1-2]
MQKNKYKFLLLLLAFTLLILNVFAQSPKLHAEVSGKGKQSIVLLPGFGCSGKVWEETVQQLSSKYSCHVITFPGFAGTPALGEANLKDWETAVADYITTQKISPAIIIGHSIGGGMALSIAADHPTLVKQVVVTDAVPCLAAMFNPAFTSKENLNCTAMVGQFTAMPEAQFLKMQQQIIPTMVADTARQRTVIDWTISSDRNTMGRIYCQFSNTDLREKIAQVKCPSLVLLEVNFKDNDAIMQQQYAKLSNKTIAYSTKGLHFIMYDDKDWFFQQLASFLQ